MQKSIQIKKIIEFQAKQFFLDNIKRGVDQVAWSSGGNFFGAYKDNFIIGVIATKDSGKSVRVKCFIVNEKYRNNGVGSTLVKSVIEDGKRMTAFATKYSSNVFKSFGFKSEKKPNKNNIVYLIRSENEKTK